MWQVNWPFPSLLLCCPRNGDWPANCFLLAKSLSTTKSISIMGLLDFICFGYFVFYVCILSLFYLYTSFDSVILCTITVYFSCSKVCVLPVVMVLLTQIMGFVFIFAFTVDLAALTSFYQSCTWNSLFRLLQFVESVSVHSAFQSDPCYWESLTKTLTLQLSLLQLIQLFILSALII